MGVLVAVGLECGTGLESAGGRPVVQGGEGHMGDEGRLPFTRKNRKFRVEIQKVSDHPFGNFRKMWVASRGDPLFPLFSVFPGGARTIHQFSTWAR